ncbi:hypothetical protein BDZ91DRAFT_728084 [Kalaharituber pfeilii]|nr:hypothetical protein BDZ91DRAFT_728084 [Kalaharituber pfeilii]
MYCIAPTSFHKPVPDASTHDGLCVSYSVFTFPSFPSCFRFSGSLLFHSFLLHLIPAYICLLLHVGLHSVLI